MALTRANVEALVIRRVGKLLAAAGLDGATVSGANADLNDPLGYAIRKLGYTVTTVNAVADADVALVTTADYDRLFDLTELRALENALGNYDAVNLRVGPRSEDLSQLGAQLQKMIDSKRTYIQNEYGVLLNKGQLKSIQVDTPRRGTIPYRTF